tara:strand:+ start:5400 stop:6431 length:1032 start_codon:yes stop_codon:yes gene_type:complete
MPKGNWESGPALGKDKQKYTKKGELRPSYMLNEKGEVVRRPRKGAKGKRDLGQIVKEALPETGQSYGRAETSKPRLRRKKYTLQEALKDADKVGGLPTGFGPADEEELQSLGEINDPKYRTHPLFKALYKIHAEALKDDMTPLEAKRKRMEKEAFPSKNAQGKLPISSLKAMRDFRGEYSPNKKPPPIQSVIPRRGPSLMGFGDVGSYNVYGGRSNLHSIIEQKPAVLPHLPGYSSGGGGGPAGPPPPVPPQSAKPKLKPRKKKGPNYQKGYAKGYALGGAKGSTFDTELEALAQHYMNPGKAHSIVKINLRGKVKYQLRKGKVLFQADSDAGKKRNESTVFL